MGPRSRTFRLGRVEQPRVGVDRRTHRARRERGRLRIPGTCASRAGRVTRVARRPLRDSRRVRVPSRLRMTGTEDVLQRLLDDTSLTVALFHGDQEASPRGYRPVPFRNWHVRDGAAVAVIRFGPYDAAY